jgi:hypothetical protein
MKSKTAVIIVAVLLVGGVAVALLWPGSRTEEEAVEVRDAFTGKTAIDQGERLKGQLGTIGAQKKGEADALFQ